MMRFHPALRATIAAVAVASAGALPAPVAAAEAAKPAAATVEPVAGSKVSRVTLAKKAAERLDIKTEAVGAAPSGRTIAPYAAIVYDLAGAAWVYTNPTPLTYVRHAVVIDTIKGKDAYLKDGPPVGTQVVTVGVSELYGAEKGVGH